MSFQTSNTKISSLFTLMVLFLTLLVFSHCGNSDGEDIDDDPPKESFYKVRVNPAVTYQEMVGFGSAVTWYCDRVTSSSKKEELYDLMFDDLGLDILRLKNWYYPVNYPDNKSTAEMEVSWFKQHFDATNVLFDVAKQKNPNIKVLLSSWGPPSSLKSNNKLEEGTLKKDENGKFMYEEYATYWEDALNHIAFNPDYLSIQNEPSYINQGWTTCEWRPTQISEAALFPGYDIAFDLIYDKIKDKANPPVMIGSESANLGNSSFGNTFSTFADKLKDKNYLGMHAYHPYNLNESSTTSNMELSLKVLENYQDRPNMMSEYSGMSWFKTAQFINRTLYVANTSAYIYWELMWAETSDYAMIKVTSTGNYELTPFYYLMKHYAKHISQGYKRIDLSSQFATLDAVSFISPAGDKVTSIILNPSGTSIDIKIEVANHPNKAVSGWESTESSQYVEIQNLSADSIIRLKANSITTIVVSI